MPTTEAPNSPPPELPTQKDGQNASPGTNEDEAYASTVGLRINTASYGDLGTDELVQRINELEDERRAARIREGIWVALLFHAAILLLWAFGPRYLLHQTHIISPAEAIKNRKDLTYLDLPPDALKQPRPKKPVPVQDHHEATEHPTVDKKTLQDLEARQRAGAPTPPPVQPTQQVEQPETPQPVAPQPSEAQTAKQSMPQLRPAPSPLPPQPRQNEAANNPFKVPSSAGDMIRQATRGASAPSTQGEYGQNPPAAHGGMGAGVEILSDTLGYDFDAYIKRLVAATYVSWDPLIPEVARPPLSDRGKVFIDFVLHRDGSVSNMVLRGPSGVVPLDRAAWGGIKGAGYPPLPKDFKGDSITLRFGFFYNIKPDEDR